MEGKSMVKLSYMVAFLLLASLFQPLMASELSDEIEVLRLPVEKENQVDEPEMFCPGKLSWPELVGEKAVTAEKIIKMENPIVHQVRLLFPGMVRPLNYVCGRVYLVVNWKRIVQITPTMG